MKKVKIRKKLPKKIKVTKAKTLKIKKTKIIKPKIILAVPISNPEIQEELPITIPRVPIPDLIPQPDKVLLTKTGKLRKRKPKTSNIYFTEDTENAIIEYLATVDTLKRNEIYNKRIDYAFSKLAENIIHTFKFYYTDVDTIPELKHEVVSFLLSKLHLYRKEKGKAYSYFGTIAKRWLIIYNEKNYKKLKEKGSLEEVDEDRKVYNEIIHADSSNELNAFIDIFVKYIDLNISKIFTKIQDVKIADAIIELFRRRETIDVFNKKALFIYTREIVDVKTPQITKIIKRLKEIYIKLYNIYYEGGDINMTVLYL